ncbi:MAG: penicillin-binding transpeptidase domain-containing protein [Chromatiales bacterium]|nr:penicillin-binding transpeptidase domain-containing protein [Chromatiales bacterium]
MSILLLAGMALAARSLDLQVLSNAFLAEQGEARHIRIVPIVAPRGPITDRNGEPLAISTPVDSVWVNPRIVADATDRLPELARSMEVKPDWLKRRIASNMNREFLFLQRHMSPERALRVEKLNIPGVYLQREYHRYYPAGEVTGHLLGFTDIDDRGQEGLELAYDGWLAGEPGFKRVLRDRRGNTIEVEQVEPLQQGQPLELSLDLRIQYLAYRELKAAVKANNAKSGSIVVIDVTTGEVLAMANQPSFNPNDRSEFRPARYRNRAVTDIFEPGSSIKPFVIAAALESGTFRSDSTVDTSPGSFKVGSKLIQDKHNLGNISLATVLTKSSNVGVTKIAMELEARYMWNTFSQFGFGALTGSGLPAESAGLLANYNSWRPISQATMSYGYGMSVTLLQLTEAYATLANHGEHLPISLLRLDEAPRGDRVVSPATARALIEMMETVVADGGTGTLAAVNGYQVAGKTGTSWKADAGGYSQDRYVAVFAGLAPASNPRLATVVMLDEPSAGKFYGGEVAAPVFSNVTSGALRLLAVAPDNVPRRRPGEIIQAMRDRP